jgi:hypothetical protein
MSIEYKHFSPTLLETLGGMIQVALTQGQSIAGQKHSNR